MIARHLEGLIVTFDVDLFFDVMERLEVWLVNTVTTSEDYVVVSPNSDTDDPVYISSLLNRLLETMYRTSPANVPRLVDFSTRLVTSLQNKSSEKKPTKFDHIFTRVPNNSPDNWNDVD